MIALNLLFLCTGNAARSVMSEALLRQKVQENVADISSAGTFAIEGLPCSRRVQKALETFGLSALNHRSHQITEAEVDWADIIIGFEVFHIDFVRRNFSSGKSKAVLFNVLLEKLGGNESHKQLSPKVRIKELGLEAVSYDSNSEEVVDPDKGGEKEMEECAREISSLVDGLCDALF